MSLVDSPYHLLSTRSALSCTRGRPHFAAKIRAVKVFPVPGGPSKSTARGRLDSKRARVKRATASNASPSF